jgi:hypothetical protein
MVDLRKMSRRRAGSWRVRNARIGTVVVLFGIMGCSGGEPDDSNVARGRGLKLLVMEPAAEASVVDAAVRASFDMQPGLVLLAHPRRLPRTAGYEGGDAMPAPLVEALRARGVVRGTCEPRHEAPRDTPRCPGAQTGYVVRISSPFRAGGDTVQLNFMAETFAPESGARPQALRFEKIYQLVGSGESWRVAREARVREPR